MNVCLILWYIHIDDKKHSSRTWILGTAREVEEAGSEISILGSVLQWVHPLARLCFLLRDSTWQGVRANEMADELHGQGPRTIVVWMHWENWNKFLKIVGRCVTRRGGEDCGVWRREFWRGGRHVKKRGGGTDVEKTVGEDEHETDFWKSTER